MRLWPWQMIPILPRQQLLGQHRECCALRGNGWGKPHSVVNYVFDHSRIMLYAYHMEVLAEFMMRGYHFENKWTYAGYCGQNSEGLSDDYIAAHSDDLNSTYPEHDEKYYNECVKNLAGKGIEEFMRTSYVPLFNRTAHRELWGWVSDNPDSSKTQWPGWKENGGKYQSDNACFACNYSEQQSLPLHPGNYCHCPLVWPSLAPCSLPCFCGGSPFTAWSRSSSTEERRKYAAMLRDLPLVSGVLCY